MVDVRDFFDPPFDFSQDLRIGLGILKANFAQGTLSLAGQKKGFLNTAFATLAGQRLLAALHQFRKQVLGLGGVKHQGWLVRHSSNGSAPWW